MLEHLTSLASRDLPEALRWLRRMVEINSFTTNIGGVRKLGLLTAECFEELGFQAEFVHAEHPAHGPHVFLHRPGSGADTVLLVTHLDTVFPPEEEAAQGFEWSEEGDRIYGPGTVDNKGGTMLIWLMLRLMREALPDLFERTSWWIGANSAEEVIGSDFAKRAAKRCGRDLRCVLVFEGWPRDDEGYRMVTSRKGRLEYRLTCTGRAAHAGSEHAQGINAVVELARLLPKVADLTDPARDLTVNVAHVAGGTVLNRVPHHAVAELEMRAIEPQVLARAAERLESLAGVTPAGAVVVVERVGETAAWPGGPGTEALFRCWEDAAATMGIPLRRMARGGLSDANYLYQLAPTLDALGPGGGNAHCSERSTDGTKLPEYVEVRSFIPKAVLNALALAKFLKTSPERPQI